MGRGEKGGRGRGGMGREDQGEMERRVKGGRDMSDAVDVEL